MGATVASAIITTIYNGEIANKEKNNREKKEKEVLNKQRKIALAKSRAYQSARGFGGQTYTKNLENESSKYDFVGRKGSSINVTKHIKPIVKSVFSQIGGTAND